MREALEPTQPPAGRKVMIRDSKRKPVTRTVRTQDSAHPHRGFRLRRLTIPSGRWDKGSPKVRPRFSKVPAQQGVCHASCKRRFLRLSLTILAIICLSCIVSSAQSTQRQIGTPFEVTADPLVPRPNEAPCVVTLFSNYTFAHFSDSTQIFPFAPPTNCAGPWQEVVLEVNFSENAGAQFDRTASISSTSVVFSRA